MDFIFTEEQEALYQMALQFSEKHLVPFALTWDEQHFFPKPVLQEAAQLGLGGMLVSEAYGGSDVDRLSAALVFEGLASGCVTTSAFLSIHNMVAGLINRYASDALKIRFLKKLATMEIIGAYCLTEPEAGSDAAALKTRAVLENNHYIINGTKAFISGGGKSDVYLCMVRTGDLTHHGISAMLVEKGMKGLSFGPPEKKMGWKNQPTTMVYFENVKVPIENLVGEEGMGFKMALHALNGGRINIAACSLGGAATCLKRTQSYLQTRQQFGQTLSHLQGLRFMFANMMTEFQAARLMVYRAASVLEQGLNHALYDCAMAKKFATEVAFKVSDGAMQLHGGYGYLADYHIERIFRDLRVHRILEGTNEIMQEMIARAYLDEGMPII